MPRINLNGAWDFVVDLDPKYHRQPAYADPGWDRRHWRKVAVPGVWNHYDPRLDIYEGVCWFARSFSGQEVPDGATCLLRFGGVNYLCDVYLNGEFVGSHEGGYTEFVLDVSGKVKLGGNMLVVKADNRATSTRLPPVLGYFNYGGIHRDVSLEIHAADFFEDVFVRALPNAAGGAVEISGRVRRCSKATLQATGTCHGERGSTAVDADGRFGLSFDVPGVSPWSPDSPNLYPVAIELTRDDELLHRREWNTGFRKVETQADRILLNGQQVRLNGLCYVYDSPESGVVLKPGQYEADLQLMKALGVNAIRSHSPLTYAFYAACDQAGILVWIEPPIYCIHVKGNETGTVFADPSFQKLAVRMVQEMVVHARNHPSVVLYGIGNECSVANREAKPFFRSVAAHVRGLDSTRLLSYASLYGDVGDVGEVVDVIGVNAYWGWYDRLQPDGNPKRADRGPADLSALTKCLATLSGTYAKPLLLTEFGADSVPGFRSGELELWSEDYHAYLLREILKTARRFPSVCGTFPFCFSDYRDPSKYTGAHWDGMNYKGVVTYDRRKKAAFDALAQEYG